MKRILIISSVFSILIACNDAGNKDAGKQTKAPEDSLMEEVMHGHDFAMAKMNRIPAIQKKVQQAIDSINMLPEKVKKQASGYKAELDILSEKLSYADFSMNKWMEEFNYDTATQGSNRSAYLESENKKIIVVKEALLSALQKADSLFKK